MIRPDAVCPKCSKPIDEERDMGSGVVWVSCTSLDCMWTTVEEPPEETTTMNYSTAIFLINSAVRAISVSYELDADGKPEKFYIFKSLDPSIGVGDFVVVPTTTRHNMTICRVEAVDLDPPIESHIDFKWIIAKVDCAMHETILEQEQKAIATIKSGQRERKRREIAEDVLGVLDEEQVKALPLYKENGDS